MLELDKKMHSPVWIAALLAFGSSTVLAQTTTTPTPSTADCSALPSYSTLKTALQTVQQGKNSGLGFNMWATIVNRDGFVCAVVFTGTTRGDQWPGSRVISAQKASTANAFSLPAFALSTANLYAATQNGGPLFGLQFSNPVDADVAYAGDATQYGQTGDPLVGKQIGGVNVFGGGLALYVLGKKVIGALGVSGDTSCTDHIIAWKVRNMLQLDNVPNGVGGVTGGDNMINDLIIAANGVTSSPSGYGHATCDALATSIVSGLPATTPLGPHLGQ
jgi:uncharacterized protein GlcG (DUF336 family)